MDMLLGELEKLQRVDVRVETVKEN